MGFDSALKKLDDTYRKKKAALLLSKKKKEAALVKKKKRAVIRKKKILHKVARETDELIKFAHAESRHFDLRILATFVNTTATLTLINGGMNQSNADEGRQGNSILLKWLKSTMRVVLNSISPGEAFTVRILVVYDKQTNYAAPADTDILEDPSNPDSQRTWETRDRFITLYDKKLKVSFGGHHTKFLKLFKRLDLPVYYGTATTGMVNNISQGSIYLMTLSDNPDIRVFMDGDFRIVYMP